MKIRKVMLLAALTAAIGSANLFAAFADEEDLKVGWQEEGSNWVYYENGSRVTNRLIYAEDGDGRGNTVCYYVDGTGVMVTNTTQEIDGKVYEFGEDGSWVAPYEGAPKGTISGNSFYNTWSNIRLDNMIGTVESDYVAEDQFTGEEFASIGSPKLTHDLYLTTSVAGDLEIYYADMRNKPNLDAATFASEIGRLTKGKNGQASAVTTVNIGGQDYSKITVTKKKRQTDYYCRKQENFMVVISTTGSVYDAGTMAGIVSGITVAR